MGCMPAYFGTKTCDIPRPPRYRVVPSCYRRALPIHLKSHRSHDVVLLCVTCHEVAHGVSSLVHGLHCRTALLTLVGWDRIAAAFAWRCSWLPALPPLCLLCHAEQCCAALCCAVQAAEKLKRRLAAEYGVPLLPPLPHLGQQGASAGGGKPEGEEEEEQEGSAAAGAAAAAEAGGLPHPFHVRQAAVALERHAEDMPPDRRRCDPPAVRARLSGRWLNRT